VQLQSGFSVPPFRHVLGQIVVVVVDDVDVVVVLVVVGPIHGWPVVQSVQLEVQVPATPHEPRQQSTKSGKLHVLPD